MVTKRRDWVRGSQAKNVRKKCCSESNVWTRWRCRRCYNNTPDRAAGTAQAGGCGENWRALLRRVERRTRSPKVRRQRLKSFGRKLSGFEDKEGRPNKMDRVIRSEGKVVLRKTGAWKWRMR